MAMTNGGPLKAPEPIPPYLEFFSQNSFTLEMCYANTPWDGIMQYSTDIGSNWVTWDGSTITSASVGNGYGIWLRGIGNTKIGARNSTEGEFIIYGSDVYVNGNIENLLDYTTVTAGNHPVMSDYCFYGLFRNCGDAIVSAPTLPATTLSEGCYLYMFSGCYNLTSTPELPATTLADSCYAGMFRDCTGLTSAPELPATTLTNHCYDQMFDYCTGLTSAPELPATTLASYCYSSMFRDCTGLTSAPELPATTLASYCYFSMFYGCTNLETIPQLPDAVAATTYISCCYMNMFRDCKASASETQTGEYITLYKIPTISGATNKSSILTNMFDTSLNLSEGQTIYIKGNILTNRNILYINAELYEEVS